MHQPSSVIDILIPIISGHVSGKASPQYCIEALLVLRPFLSCVDTSAAGHIAGQTVKALSVTHILSAARDDALTAAVLGVCEIICSSPYVELLKGDSSMEALTVMIWLLGRSSPTHLPSVHARCYEIMENLAMVSIILHLHDHCAEIWVMVVYLPAHYHMAKTINVSLRNIYLPGE